MGRSSGGGGRSSGGGRSAGGVNQAPLGETTEEPKERTSAEKEFIFGAGGPGALSVFDSSELRSQFSLGSASPDPRMVRAFSRGELNQTPALVSINNQGKYEPVDSASAKILASGRVSGANNINVQVIARNDLSSAQAAASIQGKPRFGRNARGQQSSFSEIGTERIVSPDSIIGGRTKASQSKIDKAARTIRSNKGSTWITQPVVRVGPDSYRPIGDAAAVATARRANTEVRVYVVGEQF